MIKIMYRTKRVLKAAKKKKKEKVTYKGRPIRITPDFIIETLKPRRAWTDVLQILRPQMPAQTIILCKTLNHNRCRK